MLSGALALPAAAQTTDPVWSTTMTAGDTPVGHGYDRTDLDAPTIGALDDDNFDYGSSFYGVLALDVATNVVRFVVAETGLPTNEILTLELGGHALAFSDRHNFISGQSRWYWTVPAALDDLETEFPVGSTATVCLRTATQVCPTGSIVTPPTDANAAPSFSSSATFDAAENQTSAGTVLAADSDSGDDVTGYAITGGADQTFFSIGATSGALTFDDAPNFEDAQDQGTNNTYVVEVQATSGTGTREKTATQTITVTVTDVAGEAPGKPAAPTVAPASVTSLTVTWTKPANAGPAITDYDVQYREGTTGNWSGRRPHRHRRHGDAVGTVGEHVPPGAGAGHQRRGDGRRGRTRAAARRTPTRRRRSPHRRRSTRRRTRLRRARCWRRTPIRATT